MSKVADFITQAFRASSLERLAAVEREAMAYCDAEDVADTNAGQMPVSWARRRDRAAIRESLDLALERLTEAT